MAMIKGISVVLKQKIEVGRDEFNHPIYRYEDKVVENVLVAPATSNDITTSIDLTGKRAEYTMAIPKGDSNNWKDQLVEFFGHTWKTFGIPLEGIEANIPLDWNKKVMVELYE